ncbi:hypothetical protein WISP_146993 [Willisornis vidua]|uniref:Uncharacterized protein n=1 Tax=Willisornis vidua TaxID=1566151 RepID=A0ABQ9CPT5_9PASS|nr:hypothetical protein WISP_146993 [Willisornis vidua]
MVTGKSSGLSQQPVLTRADLLGIRDVTGWDGREALNCQDTVPTETRTQDLGIQSPECSPLHHGITYLYICTQHIKVSTIKTSSNMKKSIHKGYVYNCNVSSALSSFYSQQKKTRNPVLEFPSLLSRKWIVIK